MSAALSHAPAEVAACRAADLPAVKARFAEWFRFNPRLQEDDFLTWQFQRSPVRLSDDELDLLLLWREGEIQGCIGYSGFRFSHEGQIREGGWPHCWINAGPVPSDGLLLLSAFQSRADSRIMMRLSEDAMRVHRLYRVPLIEKMPRWWASPDPEALTAALASQPDRAKALDWRVVMSSADRLDATLGARAGEPFTRIPEGHAFSMANWPSVRSWALRDAAYLNWRYADIPRHDYRILAEEDELAVFRIEPAKDAAAHVVKILEWTVAPANAAGFMTRILEQAGHAGCALIDFHCTAEAIGDSLTPLGFVREAGPETAPPDLFRPTNWSGGYQLAIDLPPHRRPREIDFSSWCVTLGDSDLDRVKL